MTVNRLPVMDDLARIFADEVRLNLLDRRRDGERSTLDDRLAQADDPAVCVDLEKQPAGLDEESLQPGDPDRVASSDRGLAAGSRLGLSLRLHAVECRERALPNMAPRTFRLLRKLAGVSARPIGGNSWKWLVCPDHHCPARERQHRDGGSTGVDRGRRSGSNESPSRLVKTLAV